jgi:GNAT superfamily N-acetyltransferase
MLNPTAEHEHIDGLQMTVERAERAMIYDLTEAARCLNPNGQITTLLLQCGGAAVFVPDSADFRLNFAFLTHNGLFEHDMQVLENAYALSDRPVSLFIPKSAPNAAFDRLKSRGFSARSSMNVFVCLLDEIKTNQPVESEPCPLVDGMIIAPATPEDFDAFVEYHGRGDDGIALENLKLPARIGTRMSNTTIILAKMDGCIIGATSVTYLKAGHGELVAYTALTSTLAKYRGRGVSTALKRFLHVRAKERGCRWVFAHVDSDNSGNGRVLEKLGYKLLFAHIVCVKGSES